jgi:chromate transporter
VWTSAIKTSADLALALVTFALLALWAIPAWLVVVIAAVGGAVLGAL